MKFGVVVFPGSNCDRDCFNVLEAVCGQEVSFLWHQNPEIGKVDCVVLPGGFSYGDYLRAGAIASRSPVINSVVEFAKSGGLVIGICNGFQVLTECGLLPGALMQNSCLSFVCKDLTIRVENNNSRFTSKYSKDEVINIPVAHMDGNYYVSGDTLKELNDNGQILFRYCNSNGELTEESNPNGSLENIAGICSRKGNILGMMPHPERCSEEILTGVDGKRLFESVIESWEFGKKL